MYRHITLCHHQGVFVVVIRVLSNGPLYCWSVTSPGSMFSGARWISDLRPNFVVFLTGCRHVSRMLSFMSSPRPLSLQSYYTTTASSDILSPVLAILYIICQGRWKRAVKSTRKLIESLFRESVNRHLLYDTSGSHGCKLEHYDLVGCKRPTLSGWNLQCFHIIGMT